MARVEIHDRDGIAVLAVFLSERNLWTLLSKLYTPGSACAFWNGDCPPDFSSVLLAAERDELHYASASRGAWQGLAGAMHPVTEAIMARARPAIIAAVQEIGEIGPREPPSGANGGHVDK